MTDLHNFEHLRDTLDDLAASTWHKARLGPQRGLKFGEESITDHNLFELDQRCTGIEVYKFNHAEEAGNGADFEWFIGGDADGWVGMRFQAKILDDGSYKQLGHQIDGEMQYDRLMRRAASDGMWPFYCFYNGWSGGWPDNVRNRVCDKNVKPTPKGRLRGCTHANLEDFGCALAPAGFVARRHGSPPRKGKLELDDYLARSRPWSHIFGAILPVAAVQSEVGPVLDRLASTLRGWTLPGPDEQRFDRDPTQGMPYEDGRRELLPDWLAAARAREPVRTDARRPRLAAVIDLAVADEVHDEVV